MMPFCCYTPFETLRTLSIETSLLRLHCTLACLDANFGLPTKAHAIFISSQFWKFYTFLVFFALKTILFNVLDGLNYLFEIPW